MCLDKCNLPLVWSGPIDAPVSMHVGDAVLPNGFKPYGEVLPDNTQQPSQAVRKRFRNLQQKGQSTFLFVIKTTTVCVCAYLFVAVDVVVHATSLCGDGLQQGAVVV